MQDFICLFLLLFIIYLLNKQHKLIIEKEKKEYVEKIIHGEWQIDHYQKKYDFYYLEMLQNQLELSNEYKFDRANKEQIMKIFEEFKKDLSKKYFSNRIGLPKTKYALNTDTFLMYSLYLFLDDRYYYGFFGDEPMHKETVSRKDYEYDGYDETYSVTEFAIILFKLLYTSYMYCKTSKVLNPKGEFFNNEKHIEELINTRKISVSCYRP